MNVLELQDSDEYQEVQDLKAGTIFYKSEYGYYMKLGWEGELDKDNGIYYYPAIYLKGGGIKYFPGNQKIKVFKNKLEIKEKGALDVNKIKVTKVDGVELDSLKTGQVFEYDGNHYMKMDKMGEEFLLKNIGASDWCCRLDDGIICIIKQYVKVNPICGKIELEV